jgi:hypothetical protein
MGLGALCLRIKQPDQKSENVHLVLALEVHGAVLAHPIYTFLGTWSRSWATIMMFM